MQKMTLRIRGQVQGVGFRTFLQNEATVMDVVGFVRNMKDGSLEVVAEAEDALLQDFFALCEEGPRLAMIDDIDDVWENISKTSFSEFEIKY